MPIKRNKKVSKTKTPAKKTQEKPVGFKRKIKTQADDAPAQQLTVREATMVVVYRTLKTVPCSITDIGRVFGGNMTPSRMTSAENHFDKFMSSYCKRIENYFDKKGMLEYLTTIVVPSAIEPEYAEDSADEE